MNEAIQAIVLGIAQGVGEFLPISSTAHLIIIPYFFHWPDPGLGFDVALHFGTLIAVLAYFWREWKQIIKLAVRPPQFYRDHQYTRWTLWLLVIATVPGVIFGYYLEDKAETVFRSPLIIALTLSLLGLILFLADKYLKHRKTLSQTSLLDSIVIGLSQAVAIIPGVSRSGATITAGLMRGLDRVDAARFSFLLSTPIILGATVLKFPQLLQEGLNMPVILGIIVSALSGYLAIKYLLQFIEKVSYRIFFWYRIALAALIVINIAWR